MNPTNFKLLIHHHDVAYVTDSGEIWLTAGIGRWVVALAAHFKEIGLLLHQSQKRLPRQDTVIAQANITLYSLGTPGFYWDHIQRLQHIRQVCQEAGRQADGLLIRGLTPRQHTVWKYTPVSHKAFLLVRSPKQERVFSLRPLNLLGASINRYREYEFTKIAKSDITIMANSPLHLPEIEAISGRKAYFVPTNTIQNNEFASLHHRAINIPFRLLYIGRLHFLKGLRELFHALAKLKQQGVHCTLDMVGAYEEPGYTQLLGIAQQAGVADLICWHGHIPFGPKLLKFYLTADVFILPTYTEGFPRVLWEASANCCPIVTTAVGGIPALLEHEKHALLIPPKDDEAIVNAVKRLYTDENLRQRLVEQAYHYALNFSAESCARELATTLAKEWN